MGLMIGMTILICMNMVFDNYELVTVLKEGIIKKVDDEYYKKKVYVEQDVLYPVTDKERELFHIEITLQKPKEEWRNKKLEPDIVGKAIIYLDQKPIRKFLFIINSP